MPPKLIFKHCLRCYQPYNTYDEDKNYCTDSCEATHKRITDRPVHQSNQMKGPDRKCPWCNKLFTYSVKNKRYCDATCQIEHSIYTRRERHAALIQKKICDVCGTEFYGHKLRKYCNYRCYNQRTQASLRTALEKKKGPSLRTRDPQYHKKD